MTRGREVSDSFKAAVFAQETEEVFLILVTVEHQEMENPIRLVNNIENIISRGESYLACPLQIELPIDADEQSPVAKLTMDNLDKIIIAALRTISDPPTVHLELVRASAPDVIEAAFYDLTLKQVNYDYFKIEGMLTYENLLAEPWPAHTFTPSYFPGLY
ncbi:MAG: DUF1833 family protein [Candidatus Thermoplasmatota archaeon]|nr:DUF1833 family protein [Candidatus Thermoplasmatota archaeon]